MPNDEWLYPVPESILFEAIRNARDRGTPFTTNEACLSYMLDRKKKSIRSVREYSRIWKWPYSTTRRRMREIEADVGQWATFYGANKKELQDPEGRTLAEQLAAAQGGSKVDHSRITSGSKNGLPGSEKAESGSEVDQKWITRGSQLLETETKKEEEKTSSDSEESHVAPVSQKDVVRYFKDKGVPEREALAFYDYWETREWVAESHTSKDRGKYVEITAGTWKRRAGTWIKNWRNEPNRKIKKHGQARTSLKTIAARQQEALELGRQMGLE
jgi:hypothetical protein